MRKTTIYSFVIAVLFLIALLLIKIFSSPKATYDSVNSKIDLSQPNIISKKNNSHLLTGEIANNFLNNLFSIQKKEAKLLIDSNGGYSKQALLAGKLIYLNKHSVHIGTKCLSGCAEFLLTPAQKVTFHNYPIIGFHWNVPIIGDLYESKYGSKKGSYCLNEHRRKVMDFQLKTGFKEEFYTELKNKIQLEITNREYNQNNNCYSPNIMAKNSFWLPNSQQLSTFIDFNFSGKVCSDEPVLCKQKIDQRWKQGTRIIIGDELYVSKGLD